MNADIQQDSLLKSETEPDATIAEQPPKRKRSRSRKVADVPDPPATAAPDEIQELPVFREAIATPDLPAAPETATEPSFSGLTEAPQMPSSADDAAPLLEGDMQSRREAAMRMKRGIDDMSDSIAAMQAFFSKKATTQAAMAQQAKNIATKAAKRAAREQAARNAAARAAAARLTDATRPSAPMQPLHGKNRLDRWGRPIAHSTTGTEQPVHESPLDRSATTETAKIHEIPVLKMSDVLRCGAADLAALADEARLDETGTPAFATKNELVLALLSEHVRRGGAAEAEGVYIQTKEQSGTLVAAANGLRKSPFDIRIGAQIAAAAGLRSGDYVVCRVAPGGAAPRQGTFLEAIDVVSVNGLSPEKARRQLPFDAFLPLVPSRRIRLACEDSPTWLCHADKILALAEGTRAILALPVNPGLRTAALLAQVASSMKKATSSVNVVLALFDPDPYSLAQLGTKAAEERESGRTPAFDLVFQNPCEYHEKSTSFVFGVCEMARRRAAMGKRVVIVTDAPGAFSRGFARNIPCENSLAPDSSFEREAGEFKRLWGSARVLDGAGSLTIFSAVRLATKYDKALFDTFRLDADWSMALGFGTDSPEATVSRDETAPFARFAPEALGDIPEAKSIVENPAPVFKVPSSEP